MKSSPAVPAMASPLDLAFEKGLPSNPDAERYVLGSILLNDSAYLQAAGALEPDDFSLEKHRRIFARMKDLYERGSRIDRITLADELMKQGQLESVDGLSYLISLDDGLPELANLEGYIRIVKDKSTLRKLIFNAQKVIHEALLGEREPDEILASAEESLLKLGEGRARDQLNSPTVIVEQFPGGVGAFLDPSQRVRGLSTGFAKFDEMTGGLNGGELVIIAARPSMGKCLAANAEIVLADGSVRTIEEICRQGARELLTLADGCRLEWTSPSAYVDDGVKPVFRVRTRLGRSVDTTLTHPFLTFDGWNRLEDLRPGDTIAVARQVPVFGSGELSDTRAKILGYLLGDGCLTDGAPEFTNSDPRLRDDFVECLQLFGGVPTRIEDSDGTRSPAVSVAAGEAFVFEKRCRFAANLGKALNDAGRTDRSLAGELGVSPSLVCQWKQARCVPVGDASVRLAAALGVSGEQLFEGAEEAASRNAGNALTRWLESIGLWGRTARFKFVPDVVFRGRRRAVAFFLNRLFATDGWAAVLASGQAQVGFASVSERLARQVQHLLLRFGIIAALRRKAVLYNGARTAAWRLDIAGAESIRVFASEIGIFGKERQLERVVAAIEKKRPHSNRDLIPKEVWKQIEAAKGELSWAEVARRIGLDGEGPNLHVGKGGLSRGRLAQIAEALGSEPLRALAASDLYWDRIVSIEYLGRKQVYDLTVPETHNFIANDVCVHNTALALNIAQHVATHPRMRKPVAVFSLEMSSASLLTRLVCAAARVDQHKFRAGFLNQEERRKLQEALFDVMQSPLFLDDTAGVNLMDVHSKLRRLKNEHGLAMVVIDYLQLMSSRGRAENRNQEVSAISRGLKLLAKDLNVPFLVLSQLSRASETRPGDHKPQLSDLRDSGCLTGDTLVTLACTGESRPIRDLIGKKGLRVWSLNQESLRLEPADVSNAFSIGTRTVFRLTTQLGRSICATANHRFLEFGGWKRLDQLKIGDCIALPRVVPSPSRTSMKPAELALLGHLLGDGCTLPRHVLQYAARDRDLAEAVVEFALEVFGADVAPRIRVERQWLQVYLSATRRHTRGVGSPVADWLKQLGAWGLRAYEKQIPRKVFEQDAESTALFLRHLWSTDGAIHLGSGQARISYASSSQSLSRDVQSLLVRLGINARIRSVEQRAKPHYRRQFPVAVTGKPDLVRFCEIVGAFGARKLAVLETVREHLSSTSANANRDVLPADVWRRFALPAMRQQGISGRRLASTLGIAYNGSRLYRQNLGRERAQRIAQATASEPLRKLAESDVYWDRISSVESLGEQEVFDLTVPGHENFIANDVIVHNSIEQDADLVAFIYREEVYKRDREDLKGLADLIVAKQRNGPIGVVPLRFLGQFTRFENRAEDLADIPAEE